MLRQFIIRSVGLIKITEIFSKKINESTAYIMMYNNNILKDNHADRQVTFRFASSSFVVMFVSFFLLWISTILALPPQPGDLFELSILHINDFHARFEEISHKSRACKPHMDNCIGGFSRLYTAVTTLKQEYLEALFLNAGDNFQGTIFINGM